jgi:hypothetical protein
VKLGSESNIDFNMSNEKRVFISYSHSDQEKAQLIKDRLVDEGVRVVGPEEIKVGESFIDEIKYLYESSEIILVLLSEKLFKNDKFQFEYPRYFFEGARKRNVSIIPILLEHFKVQSDFLQYQTLDFKTDFDRGLEQLVKWIHILQTLSFDKFSSKEFEQFVYDLLKEIDFHNLQKHGGAFDKGIDFIGEYYSTDPFGSIKRETWLIECKYYRDDRFSVIALKQLVDAYKYIGKGDAKVLLLTNSLLTSAAEQYLEEIRKYSNIDVSVLDGAALKNLVINRSNLIEKYFSR